MVSETQLGEYIVGAYHKIVTDCEIVSYNQRSKEVGDQLEIDVIGIESENGEQTIYTCEVTTHIDGTVYSGDPSTDRWEEFGNNGYQYTLEKLWSKFVADHSYVTRIFDDADQYVFQFWSPYVPEGYLTNGLDRLAEDFRDECNSDIEIVVNEDYTARVNELRELAAEDAKDHGEPAFRFLQILEHMR